MTGRLVKTIDLSPEDRAAMVKLLAAHFERVEAGVFAQELAEKTHAVLVCDSAALVGFSTLHVAEQTVAGELLTVVYSGDTIVAAAARGSVAFPKAWIDGVYALRTTHPRGRLIWLLLTSGFRTYRLLPTFWNEFFPRHDASTPPAWAALRDTLAGARFGDRYDTARGVVTLAHPQPLRPDLAAVPENRANDPHVRFFLDQNPGHAAGDELVCVADLSPGNLSKAGRRVVYGAARW